MKTLVISRAIAKNDDIVVMSRRDYEAMKARVPSIYLTGKAANRLDRRVAQALREVGQGKTRTIGSVAELVD